MPALVLESSASEAADRTLPAARIASAGCDPTARRICIVTGELAGPDYNGGIGTANRGLALALRRAGYAVDVLYTRVERDRPFCFRGDFAQQVDAFRRLGIRLLCIGHAGAWNDWPAKSYRAMEHLTGTPYDLVFFSDTHGTAYYPLLARRTGDPRLAATTMCVVTHSVTQWIAELNESAPTSIEDIRLMELERRSVELTDVLISPSEYMLRKYRSYGWTLAEKSFVWPNIMPREHATQRPERRRVAIDELVFFGRLERRKGLWLFCEALDRVKYRLVGRTVTFLGKPTFEDGESTGFALLRRSAAWPFEIRLLHSFDREQALSYLGTGRRLAVMPSREDNSPCVILECIDEGIPFIATRGSGGEELIAAESRADCLFEPTAEALGRTLLAALDGGVVTALPAFDPERNEQAFMQWLAGQLDRRERSSATPVDGSGRATGASPRPLLLVIVPARLDLREAVSRIGRIADLHGPGVELVVLAASPAELAVGLAGMPRQCEARVVDVRAFGALAATTAEGRSRLVGICHVTQPITPAWLERARDCLAHQPDIVALTGLVADVEAARSDDASPFVSVAAERRVVRKYVIGNAPAMFPLTQATNSGFVALRADVLPQLAAIAPLDPQYGRLKRMGDWVHELLVGLQAQGERFEVLPDCPLDREPEDEPSEVFRLAGVMRSLVGSQLGHAPGTEQAVLARLTLECMLEGDKQRSAAGCLVELADKLGRSVEDLDLDDGTAETLRGLATMAQAVGRTDLALELIGQAEFPEALTASGAWPTLAEHLRRPPARISLLKLAERGSFDAVNLDHAWSFKLLADDREIEIHPNAGNEGRASVVFRAIDLRGVDRLVGAVRLANGGARAVRFRADIVACDGSRHVSFERVVEGGATEALDVALPAATRTLCDVSLSTEMADLSASARDAWARWVDPTLTAAATG